MKRYLILFLALCLCLALAVPTLAEDAPYANAGQLYESWYKGYTGTGFPYPDCVCDVTSTDGGIDNLTFYLVRGTTEEEQEALLALVRDKDSVTFMPGGKYRVAELEAVRDAILAEVRGDPAALGFQGMVIRGASGFVQIDLDGSAAAEQYAKELYARYGDMVTVTMNSGEFNVNTVAQVVPTSAESDTAAQRVGYWPLVAAVVCMALIAFLLLRRRAVPQPAEGPDGTARKPKRLPARLQVEAAVMTAAEQPDEAVKARVLERIGKQ